MGMVTPGGSQREEESLHCMRMIFKLNLNKGLVSKLLRGHSAKQQVKVFGRQLSGDRGV